MNEDFAFKRWSALSRILFEEDPIKTFKIIKNAYETRAYHNLDHVIYCQAKYSEYLKHVDAIPDALVDVAIWFHDIVYFPGASNNEEQSFAFFNKFLGHNLNMEAREDIRRLILCTKHKWMPGNENEAIIMDVDMAILAEEPDGFNEYESNVRSEYLHLYDPSEYNMYRKAFMQELLSQQSIFNTHYFHDKYEALARNNLSKYSEIKALGERLEK